MKQGKKLLAIILTLILSISMIPTISVNASKRVVITYYKKNVTVYVGEKKCLPIGWTVVNVTKVKWRSLNIKIATVDKSGFVKGKRPGKATIILKLGKKKIKFKIKVKSVYSIGNKNITINGNRTIYMNYYKNNEADIDCYSSNNNIVQVSGVEVYKNRVSIYLYTIRSGTVYLYITNGFNNEKMKIKITNVDDLD